MAKWKNPSGTRTYFAWRSMRTRCTNPSHPQFHNYGGRGISVCPRWLEDYDAFVADMGEAQDGQTLDRINVDLGYSPDNCRWTGWDVQSLNKRNSRMLTRDGVTKTLTEWARDLGVEVSTLHRRLRRMPVDRALTAGTMAKPWSHGTRHGYLSGCRCDECRAAHAAFHRARRARKAAT